MEVMKASLEQLHAPLPVESCPNACLVLKRNLVAQGNLSCGKTMVAAPAALSPLWLRQGSSPLLREHCIIKSVLFLFSFSVLAH